MKRVQIFLILSLFVLGVEVKALYSQNPTIRLMALRDAVQEDIDLTGMNNTEKAIIR